MKVFVVILMFGGYFEWVRVFDSHKGTRGCIATTLKKEGYENIDSMNDDESKYLLVADYDIRVESSSDYRRDIG